MTETRMTVGQFRTDFPIPDAHARTHTRMHKLALALAFALRPVLLLNRLLICNSAANRKFFIGVVLSIHVSSEGGVALPQ